MLSGRATSRGESYGQLGPAKMAKVAVFCFGGLGLKLVEVDFGFGLKMVKAYIYRSRA